MDAPFTLLDDGRTTEIAAHVVGDTVRVAPEALRAATGWELKAQGLCRNDVCIPTRAAADRVNEDGVDLDAFAALVGRPLALDPAARVAYLGVGAAERSARLASLEAPDFTLPDLGGRLHSLSDFRGRKVLLLAYASW